MSRTPTQPANPTLFKAFSPSPMPQKPPYMSAADVRRAFLEFFRERGHTVVASASLVPGNDPTLLFTNAGMVQFKDVFLGRDKRDYVRAASSQRLWLAGKTQRSRARGYTSVTTRLEMLGKFSSATISRARSASAGTSSRRPADRSRAVWSRSTQLTRGLESVTRSCVPKKRSCAR